jgi:hypothetical protein
MDLIAFGGVVAMRGGTACRRSVPGRVAESPFFGCCTRAGRRRRSICAGLICSRFSLKASGSAAWRSLLHHWSLANQTALSTGNTSTGS